MKKFAAFLETGRSAAHMLDEHNPVVSSLEVKTSFFADVLDVLKIFSFLLCSGGVLCCVVDDDDDSLNLSQSRGVKTCRL